MKNSWQFKELEKYLKDNKQNELLDAKTVFLSNPTHRKELDKIICEGIYPGALLAINGSPIKITTGKDCNIKECIEEELSTDVKKSLTFMLDDPERPLNQMSNIRWFCRGKIECSVTDYMISFEFNIYFPSSVGMDVIMVLLKDPAFQGMPPNLHYEKTFDEEEFFCVNFQKGHGGTRGPGDHRAVKDKLFKDVENNLKIIYAVNELEVDYRNFEAIDKLRRALIGGYESG
jgi:hypothetical protein